MALKQNFYDEIYDKEQMWINMINSNLLNIYYLPELRDFYVGKQERLNYEYELTGNDLIRSISYSLNNIVVKLDYFIDEDKKGNIINLKELLDLFLTNKLNNNVSYVNSNVSQNNKNLYELRNKVINEGSEDYLDDDFYYNKIS